MKMKQIHFPTVSAFMHALGRDDVRHPLIEVIHLDDLDDCSSFGNTRYTFGFYCVVYKDARCGTVHYGRNEYDYDNGTLLFFGRHGETISGRDAHLLAGTDARNTNVALHLLRLFGQRGPARIGA